MLLATQKREFAERGIIRLPGLLSQTLMAESASRVYSMCRRAKCLRDDIWRAPSSSNAGRRLVKNIQRSNAFGGSMSADLAGCIHELVDGAPIHQRTNRPTMLFTLPENQSGRTDLDWHIDVRKRTDLRLAGVQLFALVNEIRPGGGGTVAISGSHRLALPEMVGREDIRKDLARSSYFAKLLDGEPNTREELVGTTDSVDGVDVEIVEMTGEPGDVYLMNLWVLHTRWPNQSREPRIMLTQRFLLQEARDKLGIRVDF